jgi:hypothetical protein
MDAKLCAAIAALIVFGGAGCAETGGVAPAPAPPAPAVDEYVPPEPLHLSAPTVRDYPAPEADQGVAVDADYFYALDNATIAKYTLDTGRRVADWTGPVHGLIRHMNSCFAENGELWCANSNYSLVPQGSSIEVFDAETMTHARSHSLGLRDEGSLTWFDHYREGWMAGFAHYDDNGGVGFKDHSYSNVVTFDAEWRRTGGWLFPPDVVERMAPHAASGGAIGPDGLLYVLGHDRPELYVLAAPSMGPTLIHVATIDVEAEGQAFSWAPGDGRTIYAIDRHIGRILVIDVPPVDLSAFPDARLFR